MNTIQINQNYYLGVDYYKNYSFLSFLDSSGKKLKEGKVSNHKENLKDFLKHIDNQNILAVMEAGRNWTVRYDLLEEIVKNVKLAHPLKVKIIAEAKTKTDKIDIGFSSSTYLSGNRTFHGRLTK